MDSEVYMAKLEMQLQPVCLWSLLSGDRQNKYRYGLFCAHMVCVVVVQNNRSDFYF